MKVVAVDTLRMPSSDLHRATAAAARRRRVLDTGLRRSATIVGVRRTGATIGTAPVYELDLELDGGALITVVEAVPLASVRFVVAGTRVTAVLAPADLAADAVVDWWASAPR